MVFLLLVFATVSGIVFYMQSEVEKTNLEEQDKNVKTLLASVKINVENQNNSILFHKNAMIEMYKKAHHTGKLPPEAEKNARRKFLQEDNNKKQGGSVVERNPYNYQPKAI